MLERMQKQGGGKEGVEKEKGEREGGGKRG
jgi:hypothetical protein